MALPLLPLIGAGLGGYSAYQQSGGDLGATLLGTGLGAVTPAGLRMAGTALGGTALGAKALAAGSRALGPLQGAAIKAGMGPIAPIPALTAAGLGAGAAGLGTLALGAPALAGKLASSVTAPARTAAAGVAGLMAPGGAGPAQYGGGALPPGLGQFGATDPYGNPLNILDPSGVAAGRRAEYGKTIEQQRDAMRTLLPEIFQASEARSKAELQRQLAAAGVRQNIITAANMLERSQQSAQQMGLNAASQAGSALTSQYQYQ
jgi:hypothetical protein